MTRLVNVIEISVCIPVYNAEKYIEKCARSLFEQTLYKGIEYIFVDDCSVDESMEIVQRLLLEYPHRREQVVILRHKKNLGRVAARRSALLQAKGHYVIYCDADDSVDVNFYEKMLNVANSGLYDVVSAPIRMVWPDGREQTIDAECSTLNELFDGHFANSYFCSLVNKLIKRTIYLQIDSHEWEQIEYGEDLLQVTQLLLRCKSLSSVHDVMYYYFRNENSGTIKNKDCRKNIENLMIVEKRLARFLSITYPEALLYLQHVILMMMLRNGTISSIDFQNFYPQSHAGNSLRRDNRLQVYKKVLIWISSHNYLIGTTIVKLLMQLDSKIHRKVA